MVFDKWARGSRNDEAQRLMSKYEGICKEAGASQRSMFEAAVARVAARGADDMVGREAAAIAHVAQNFARHLLETPEFRPLAAWWVEKNMTVWTPEAEKRKASQYQKLIDIGARHFETAIKGG